MTLERRRIYNICLEVKKRIRTVLKSVYLIIWDGSDDYCRAVPAGIYFVQVKTDDRGEMKKVILESDDVENIIGEKKGGQDDL